MTQRDKVLQMLRSQEWCSTVDFVNAYILRAGAIIFNLRKAGYTIDSRDVRGKSYAEYKLVKEPQRIPKFLPRKVEAPVQASLV